MTVTISISVTTPMSWVISNRHAALVAQLADRQYLRLDGTPSAVVGSSAISRSGAQAMPIAIITR